MVSVTSHDSSVVMQPLGVLRVCCYGVAAAHLSGIDPPVAPQLRDDPAVLKVLRKVRYVPRFSVTARLLAVV